MYSAPAGKNGVYFTKALTEANYKAGESLLGYYWRASKISKAPYAPITNFQGMLAYLQSNYPTYIESLGEMLNSVSLDKMIKAMQATAAEGLLDYPRPAYFNRNIMNFTGYSIVGVVGETAGEIADWTGTIIKILAVVSVVVLAVYFYKTNPGVKKLVKGVSK